MVYVSDEFLDNLIKEDVPYLDLTTTVLGIGGREGRISFTSREDTVLSGIEEVVRIFGKLGIKAQHYLPSGTRVSPQTLLIAGEGSAASLHMAWKVCLNLVEYCSGIATRTRKMVDEARAVNPGISIVATRKSFPGTKELSIKSILAGGAFPHRLGLSETVLIFKQHVNFLGGFEALPALLEQMRLETREKKIIVEVEDEDQARLLARTGIDGIQFDKWKPDDLARMIEEIRRINPRITLIAAGGINEGNAALFARTGVDAVATSWVYFGKPADVAVDIQP
ncbi:MAG: ModD protein [Syntrophomonadaceae bacterium]